MSSANGALVDATPESFADGLANLATSLPLIDPAEVQRRARRRTWATVVDEELVPLLQRAIGGEP